MLKKQFGRKIRNLIAAFRGLPPEESQSMQKNPRAIGDTIAILLKKISITKTTPEQVIRDNWEGIVGQNISGRCHPVKILNSDVLIIQSENAVIRSELQIQKQKILANLQRLPRCAKISDIRFIANR
ncbi:MAG: DUF721 domain-containing protein [Puniceicoccales bacterium]|nr:DUF721 domain-containing protein [Puniceicoccales bacterium]